MAATAAIQIGEPSRRTSCNIETIRYYERIGLLPVPPRRGRYRSYGREDVARLGFVRRARELGFTLDEVRALLGLAAGGQASCTEVRELAASRSEEHTSELQSLMRISYAVLCLKKKKDTERRIKYN